MILFLFDGIIAVGLVKTVVLELKGIGAAADFRLHAEHFAHAGMDDGKGSEHPVGLIGGHAEGVDEGRGNTAGENPAVFLVVEHVTEQKTMLEGEHFRGNVAVINGRAENDGVGLLHHFKNGGEFVLHGAVSVPSRLELAGEAADAAFVLQGIEMNESGFRSCGSGALQGGLQHGGRISIESGASVERKDHDFPRRMTE